MIACWSNRACVDMLEWLKWVTTHFPVLIALDTFFCLSSPSFSTDRRRCIIRKLEFQPIIHALLNGVGKASNSLYVTLMCCHDHVWSIFSDYCTVTLIQIPNSLAICCRCLAMFCPVCLSSMGRVANTFTLSCQSVVR